MLSRYSIHQINGPHQQASSLCTDFLRRAVTLALLARFIVLLALARRRGWRRATAKRCRYTRPQRTAHGVRLRLTVCLDQSVKLGLVLPDVLLLFSVEVLRLAALGLEVSQRQRGRVLGDQRVPRVCE